MSWAAIVEMILQILGPLLKDWLDQLLKQAGKDLDGSMLHPDVVTPKNGMRMVFNQARAKLWFFNVYKHWALDRLEAAMMAKADETWAAVASRGEAPKLSLREAAAIGQLPD